MIINSSGIVQNMQDVVLGMIWVIIKNPFSGFKVKERPEGPGLGKEGSVSNLTVYSPSAFRVSQTVVQIFIFSTFYVYNYIDSTLIYYYFKVYCLSEN